MPGTDIIVIGAGITGLNIAHQLARRSNLRVQVLERGPGVGEGLDRRLVRNLPLSLQPRRGDRPRPGQHPRLPPLGGLPRRQRHAGRVPE